MSEKGFRGEIPVHIKRDQRAGKVLARGETPKDNESVPGIARLLALAWRWDARRVSAVTGAFFEREKGYLHSTGFLIKPDGSVANAVYSTGSIGRLTAEDSLRVIDYLSGRK